MKIEGEDFLNLFNNIGKMHGNSLLEKILDYCDTYDEDVQEIGDILESNKNFKEILYDDCVNSNIIRDPKYKKIINRVEKIEEW